MLCVVQTQSSNLIRSSVSNVHSGVSSCCADKSNSIPWTDIRLIQIFQDVYILRRHIALGQHEYFVSCGGLTAASTTMTA